VVERWEPFSQVVCRFEPGGLKSREIVTLQVNVGRVCNQACKHCHVDAGPARTESMSRETSAHVLSAVRQFRIPNLDITGGAPELNPQFEYLVLGSRSAGANVLVRHNLTVQFVPGQEDLPEFFAANAVEVVASLPYFLRQQTDAQRGGGVFDQSVEALKRLNAVGYGIEGSGLRLDLVYNPVGAFLPPSQASIEKDFKRELSDRYGIRFNRLFTITNMPVSRFLDYLHRSGNYVRYMAKLASSFNPATLPGLMCKSLISVGWDGRLYDCDFNQMLNLSLSNGHAENIADLDIAGLQGRGISTGNHCYGCTAGPGSSCGGSLT
jgi:radical SAM/Cys-rich protein